jgi:signal transduction histidine kinase
MKYRYTSSLFFIVLFISLFFLDCGHVAAQQPIDSATYYRQKILNPTSENDLNSAYTYYENQINKNLVTNDTIAAIRSLRYFASAQFDLGLLYEAEVSAVKAFLLVKDLPINPITNEIKKGLNNQIGVVYRELENTEKAIAYNKRSLSFSANAGDSLTLRNNLANVYLDMGEFELAEQELQLVYKRRLKLDDTFELARALDNLSFVQGKLNLPSALKNAQIALDMRLELKDTKGLFSSYRHLTYYYLDRNEKTQAREYAEKCYEIAKSLKSSSFLVEALSFFVALDDEPKVIAYKRITDSISTAKQLKQNKYAAMKFDLSEEKEKTEVTKLLNEAQKRKTLVAQGIGVIVLLSGIFFFFILRMNHRKENIKQIYKTEARISKKLHDEVANDVYHVMSKLQNKDSDQEQVLDDLEDIYKRTRDISKENSIIDLDEHFEVTLSDLLLSYQSSDTTIITKNITKIDWNVVSEIKKTTLYRVLQELMTNMKKHSHATLVAVVFSSTNNKIKIDYTDNGAGCDLKKQNGLRNTENRIETIKGTISFESEKDNGFKATITI